MTNKWKPTSEEEIYNEISEMEFAFNKAEKRLWELIKVKPKKWQLSPWGDQGGGFWVIAIAGDSAIYYNDIEDGYNISTYSQLGKLEEYVCDQVSLYDIISNFIHQLQNS